MGRYVSGKRFLSAELAFSLMLVKYGGIQAISEAFREL
jgi:hypothetical protein